MPRLGELSDDAHVDFVTCAVPCEPRGLRGGLALPKLVCGYSFLPRLISFELRRPFFLETRQSFSGVGSGGTDRAS
jgi:hypothetical protein